MQLRSLCLFMNLRIPIENRAKILTQILIVCPRLHALGVGSDELALCLEQKLTITLLSVNRLHLYLDQVQEMVDPVVLATVFPNISYFSTGKQYLIMDLKLGHVVLDLIKALLHLRRLRFNDLDFSQNRDIDQSATYLVEMIRNSEQLQSVDCFVRVYKLRHMVIWI